jgi:ABC-2 type transport system permease protein
MSRILAFMRQDMLTAVSYRMASIWTILSLLVIVFPIHMVTGALQPTMSGAIANEGGSYFAFVVVGVVAFYFVAVGVHSLPTTIGAAIRSGTLEALFLTPTRVPTLLVGMMGYRLIWAVLKSLVLLLAGGALGLRIVAAGVPTSLLILGLLTLSYTAIGIMGAVLVLLFRTTGPLLNAVIGISMLLGGVYYPTHVIPSWIEHVSAVVPLTYGLRALRRTLLDGLPLRAVASDVLALALLTTVLLIVSLRLFAWALRHARQTGTLAQY